MDIFPWDAHGGIEGQKDRTDIDITVLEFCRFIIIKAELLP